MAYKCILNFYFILLIFLFTQDVLSLELEKIVGGIYVEKPEEVPYQVFIDGAGCGGALIKPNIVLTAGHCFFNGTAFTSGPYRVSAGIIDLKNMTQKVDVIKIYTKQLIINGSIRATNDIAVLRLAKGFDVSKYSPIKTIALPKKNETFDNYIAIVSGFGYDYTNTTEIDNKYIKGVGSSSGRLKYSQVTIIDNESCTKYTELEICGKHLPQKPGAKEGTCLGDSGGPLVVNRRKIIGIVRGGPPTCDHTKEAVAFVRVSSHLNFIRKAIEDKPTSDTVVIVNLLHAAKQ